MTQTSTGKKFLFITILNDRPKLYQDKLISECLEKSYPGKYKIIDLKTIRVTQKDPDDEEEINLLKGLIQYHANKSIPRFLKFEVNYF